MLFDSKTVLAVIPARYGSTRFPGKPLAEIHGQSMIRWVVNGVKQAETIDEIVVATDDERIYDEVESTTATAEMTSSDIASGSDRVAVVVKDRTADLVVNVQGDHPLVTGEMLDRGVRELNQAPEAPMVSLMTPLNQESIENPDVVKVVVDQSNRALYFSRSPIPYQKGEVPQLYEHVGIYFFQRDFLLDYQSLDPTPLERSERLEQLRVLEHGETIRMVEIDEFTGRVDRPEDIEKVEEHVPPLCRDSSEGAR